MALYSIGPKTVDPLPLAPIGGVDFAFRKRRRVGFYVPHAHSRRITGRDIFNAGGLERRVQVTPANCGQTATPTYVLTLPRVCRAAILARASTMPEFVITASGQRFSAALRSSLKSSSVIFTFTWTVRFMPPVSGICGCAATLLRVLFVPCFNKPHSTGKTRDVLDDQTFWGLLIFLVVLIVLGQKKRTRHIPTRSKRLAWAKFYQEFYRDPANKDKKLREKDYEFDHVVPFSKGGTNDPENIRVLPRKENRRKGARSN